MDRGHTAQKHNRQQSEHAWLKNNKGMIHIHSLLLLLLLARLLSCCHCLVVQLLSVSVHLISLIRLSHSSVRHTINSPSILSSTSMYICLRRSSFSSSASQ